MRHLLRAVVAVGTMVILTPWVGLAQGPSMPGMSQPMEHPVSAPPFYRERTFQVVTGIIITATGIVGYHVVRRWRRQRGRPSSVSEAVLVVDLVDSTRLATHYGDGLAMRARNLLRDRVLAIAASRGLTFAESTGDGCLMTFPSVGAAVGTAIALLSELRDRPPDVSPGPPLAVRAGVSYGEILLDARGARHGAAINKAFRLEGLPRESLAQVRGEGGLSESPERDRIFLDEEAARELEATKVPRRFVGFASLKGFSGLHRAMIEADPDRALWAVLRLGRTDAARVDVDGLRQELDRIIHLCRTRPGSRWSDEMIEATRRYGIRLPRGVLSLAKGLLLVESVALELDPAFSFFGEIQAMAPQLGFHAAEETLTRDLPRLLEDYAEAIARLPALMRLLGQRAAEGEMPRRDHRHREAET